MSRPLPELRADDQLVVTGSLAFDRIMVFGGNFKDHILQDKLHVISISFLVDDMRTMRGGCAGNIAYTAALLGDDPRVVATAGSDFGTYMDWLVSQGVDVDGIVIYDDVTTASCHITTDQKDNQITGFFVGAMARARDIALVEHAGTRPGLVIVAPDDPEAMIRHSREAREAGIPFIFDPSFQVTNMDGESLAEAAKGAAIMMLNDYELAVFREKTGTEDDEKLFALVDRVVVTLGGKGSRILAASAPPVDIPAAPISAMVDPTGAGDAYRGAFMVGLKRGFDLSVCGRLGSVAAAYAVEQHGTQEHSYSLDAFRQRYEESFGTAPGL